MQAAKAPTPGTTRPVGLTCGVEVGGDLDVGADALQGPLGAAQVAGTVVEHHDARHRSSGWGGSGRRSSACRSRAARSTAPQPVPPAIATT